MLDDLTDKWRNGEKLEWVSARFRGDQLTDAFLGVKGTTPPHPTAQAAHTSPHADTQQPPPFAARLREACCSLPTGS